MATPPPDLRPPAWLPSWLEATWNLLATYPLVLAAAILAVGLLLAFVVRGFMLYWGRKLGARTRTDLDDQLFRLIASVAALIVGYASVVSALQVLPLGDTATKICVRLAVSLLILQLMRACLKLAPLVLVALSNAGGRFRIVEERTLPLLDLVLTLGVLAITAYALLQSWKLDLTPWLASAGVIGIAVGLAARESLANLFAGFSLIVDSPYKLGDYVVLDTGERGEITKVGMRSTRLLTRDHVEVIIPNSQMADSKIINESGGPWVKFRIRLKVGVAYGSDVDHVVEVLERVADARQEVCREPARRVRMRGFGDSSLDFELLCWVDLPAQRGRISHFLYMDIYRAFDREGIEIPFPQRDLWLRQPPDSRADSADPLSEES